MANTLQGFIDALNQDTRPHEYIDLRIDAELVKKPHALPRPHLHTRAAHDRVLSLLLARSKECDCPDAMPPKS